MFAIVSRGYKAAGTYPELTACVVARDLASRSALVTNSHTKKVVHSNATDSLCLN